jgi:dTDP-4-amino-4,6-dideoxygalactose transaminase
MLCSEKTGMFYNRYLYPIIFPTTEQRDFIEAYLHSRQIGTAKPYKDIAEVTAIHYGYTGDCPVAEHIAERVLIIPSYYTLKRREVHHIADCLNKGWAELTSRGCSLGILAN